MKWLINLVRWMMRLAKEFFQSARFQLWSLWAAGPVFLAVAMAMVSAVLFNGWPIELRGVQLHYTGTVAIISLGAAIAAMFLLAGVIKKATVKFGSAEIEVEANEPEDGHDGKDGRDG